MESLPGTGQRHHTSLPPSDHLKREKKKSYLHYNNKTLEMKRNGDVLCHLGSPVFFLSYVSVCACVLLLFIFFPFFSSVHRNNWQVCRRFDSTLNWLNYGGIGAAGGFIRPDRPTVSFAIDEEGEEEEKKRKTRAAGENLYFFLSLFCFLLVFFFFFSFTCFLFEPFEINEGAPTLGDLIADRLMNLMLLLWLPWPLLVLL